MKFICKDFRDALPIKDVQTFIMDPPYNINFNYKSKYKDNLDPIEYKQTIKDVLSDMSEGQINLGSEAARETISNLISVALKTKGTYTEYDDSEIEEQEARETWVCEICGENTFEVDYDYIGSGANHI